MFRPAEDVFERPALHHLAAVHDDYFLGNVGDDTEVVGDQQHRHAEFVPKVDHQPQNLRLDRHVERGRRLVGDQQRGTADQRHRNHRPLAQSAGQLERVTAACALGSGNPTRRSISSVNSAACAPVTGR